MLAWASRDPPWGLCLPSKNKEGKTTLRLSGLSRGSQGKALPLRGTGLQFQFRPLADSVGPSTWVPRASEQGPGRGTFRLVPEAVGLLCGALSVPRASEPSPAPPSRLNLLQKHTPVCGGSPRLGLHPPRPAVLQPCGGGSGCWL